MASSKQTANWLTFFFTVFLVSIVAGFRVVTSTSLVLIIITGLIHNKSTGRHLMSKHLKNKFFLACCLFYLIESTLLIFSSNHDQLQAHLLLKSALVFVPLSLCSNNFLNNQVFQHLMRYYVIVVALVLFYCLANAAYNVGTKHAKETMFLYHSLVSPFKQHAIQVSILVFIALNHLLEEAKKERFIQNKGVHVFFVFFFTFCIILLSSKLVIIFTALTFSYYLFLLFKERYKLRLVSLLAVGTGLLMIALVLSTRNQVSKRFNEIIESNVNLVDEQQFNPGIYFNGVQFRLLQWRFVHEILNEKHAWPTGVSDNAQVLLDKKYVSTHMYTGDGTPLNRGFLGYNTHNQFLESVLRSGILGLLAFLLICFTMVMLAVEVKNRQMSFVVALLLAYSLNESLLERQYGITLFCFFPLFIYYGKRKRNRPGSM